MNALAFPQFHSTAAQPSRRYVIDKHNLTSGKWEPVAYAVGTAECDATMARKRRFDGGRYRATQVRG